VLAQMSRREDSKKKDDNDLVDFLGMERFWRMQGVVQDDYLACYRFWENTKNKHELEPPRQLLRAILQLAVSDYLKVPQCERDVENYKDAKAWFESPDEDYIYSFRYICDEFGIDPDNYYKRLKFLRRRKNSRKKSSSNNSCHYSHLVTKKFPKVSPT